MKVYYNYLKSVDKYYLYDIKQQQDFMNYVNHGKVKI